MRQENAAGTSKISIKKETPALSHEKGRKNIYTKAPQFYFS